MVRTLLLATLAAAALAAQDAKTGPEPGQRVPDFSLQDQNRQFRDLKSVMGPKGAVLVFYRSADW